jgi:hypothetical protein
MTVGIKSALIFGEYGAFDFNRHRSAAANGRGADAHISVCLWFLLIGEISVIRGCYDSAKSI